MPKLDTPEQLESDRARLAAAVSEVFAAGDALSSASTNANAAWCTLQTVTYRTSVCDADTAQKNINVANEAVLVASERLNAASAAADEVQAAIKARRATKYVEMCKAERTEREARYLAAIDAAIAAIDSNREANNAVCDSKSAERAAYKAFTQSHMCITYDPHYAATFIQ
jgi:hypothetical protein